MSIFMHDISTNFNKNGVQYLVDLFFMKKFWISNIVLTGCYLLLLKLRQTPF